MLRRTKIVATLGPATYDLKVLDSIIQAGVDVVRVNFSHGYAQQHIDIVETVRNRARAHGHQVGVIADLQGPKIRIENFEKGSIILAEDATFILDNECAKNAGNQERVGVTYKALPSDVNRGDTLLIDEGQVILWVEEVTSSQIICRVKMGGELSNGKGINRQGGGLSADALSDKDKNDIITAADMQADYLAVSFPRCADDIHLARKLFRKAGGKGGIIAKIERAEALDSLEEIIDASDVVMIARGDLGVEIGAAELPAIQKKIIKMTRERNRVSITATQMMQSMITHHLPTRAEVSDVANAILDGTDAVMLSAETAVGKFPEAVVAEMSRICQATEKHLVTSGASYQLKSTFDEIDEAIAKSTMYTANNLNVKAIAALTESGSTALTMSRINTDIPIYALTQQLETRRKVTLYQGVYPVSFTPSLDSIETNNEAIDELLRRGVVRDDDLIILTKGDKIGIKGATNVMKIIRVGEGRENENETL